MRSWNIVHKLPWYGSRQNLCGTKTRIDTLRAYEWDKVTCKKCLKINKEKPGFY